LPIDLAIYESDAFDVRKEMRIGADDEYFSRLSNAWAEALRHAFSTIEEFKA
jgi:putative proteasome-type protease